MSHLTVAASEKAFQQLFAVVRDNFSWSKGPTTLDFGPFTLKYEIAIGLENGTVDLRADNTIKISELDIKWKVLKATIGFDIEEHCVGGWCIVWVPVRGCVANLPKICVFSANPDISVPLDLSGLVTSEVSVTALPLVNHAQNHPPTTSYLDAQAAGNADKWQVFAHPQTVDVDPIDVADTVGDLLMKELSSAIEAFLPGQQWAKDLLLAYYGPIDTLIRNILDLPDDIGEWVADLLNVSIGIGNLITQAILIYLSHQHPVFEFEDPYPILPAIGGPLPLIPVKIPIKDFSVHVTDDEMIVEANVGV
jgi:hypothetical protein